MIISRGRSYVFVHIPKTAGTSMALALEARAMRDDILLGDTPKALRRRKRLVGLTSRGRLWKHARLADIDGLVTPAELSCMFTFTMVRNPWDRLVSYYFWLREQSFDHFAVRLAQQQDFAGFLADPTLGESFRRASAATYMQDATGQERCSAYLRLEHFEQDKLPIEAHLGFAIDLPHANTSRRARDYRSQYSDAMAECVADICAEDISRFGYRFDPLH